MTGTGRESEEGAVLVQETYLRTRPWGRGLNVGGTDLVVSGRTQVVRGQLDSPGPL